MGRPRARTFLEQSASRSRNQHDPTNKKEQLRQTVNRRLAERDIRCACRSTHSDDCGESNKTNSQRLQPDTGLNMTYNDQAYSRWGNSAQSKQPAIGLGCEPMR